LREREKKKNYPRKETKTEAGVRLLIEGEKGQDQEWAGHKKVLDNGTTGLVPNTGRTEGVNEEEIGGFEWFN